MTPSESERQTRKTRIDPKLRAAGWSVVPIAGQQRTGPSVAIEEFETDLGPADYVLADQAKINMDAFHTVQWATNA